MSSDCGLEHNQVSTVKSSQVK